MDSIMPIFRYVPLCCEQVHFYLFSTKRNRKSHSYKVVSCNILQIITILRGPGSSVSIVTDYGLGGPGI